MNKLRAIFSWIVSRFSFKALLSGIFIGMLVAFYFLSVAKFNYSSFNYEQIGWAVINDVDPNKRNHIMVLSLLIFGGITILYNLLFGKLFADKDTKVINIVSSISIVVLILRSVSFQASYEQYLTIGMFKTDIPALFFIHLYFFFVLFLKDVDDRKAITSIVAGFIITYCFQEIFYCLGLTKDYTINYTSMGFMFFLLGSVLVLLSKMISHKAFYKVMFVCLVLGVINIVDSLLLEFFLVLNSHNILISHVKLIVVITYLVGLAFGIGLCFTKSSEFLFKKSNVWLVTTFVLLALFKAYQPYVTNHFNNYDYYELANASNTIYGFLEYGKIPILETFDAHMLSNDFFQLIYGKLTGDYMGASLFVFYDVYFVIIKYFIIYLFFRLFFDDFSSMFITLFFPFGVFLGFATFALGLICVVSLVYFYRKKNILSCIFYITSLIFTVVYRLDIGAMYIIGTIPFFIYIVTKEIFANRKNFWKLFITTMVYAVTVVGAAFVIAAIRHVNLIHRLDEFIQLSSSNERWGYLSMGPANTYGYTLVTWLFPALAIVLYIIFIFKKDKDMNHALIFSALLIAMIFNFTRGLVRHSLIENQYTCAVSIGALLIPMLIVYVPKFKPHPVLPLTIFSFFIVCALIVEQPAYYHYSPFESSIEVPTSKYEDYDHIISRVVYPEDESIGEYKEMFDTVLNEKETFMALGWSNPSLYAFTGRECPVYENQVCGILSTIKSQQYMVAEWNKRIDDIPLALTDFECKHIDLVCPQIQFRYVYKYLGDYYAPVYSFNGSTVWARKGLEDRIITSMKTARDELLAKVSFENVLPEDWINLGEMPRMVAPSIEGKYSNSIVFYEGNNDKLRFEIPVDSSSINRQALSYFHIRIDNLNNDYDDCLIDFRFDYNGQELSYIVFFNAGVNKEYHDFYFYIDSIILWNSANLKKIICDHQLVSKIEMVW